MTALLPDVDVLELLLYSATVGAALLLAATLAVAWARERDRDADAERDMRRSFERYGDDAPPWADEVRAALDDSVDTAGSGPCRECGGTGNELLGMYRRCAACGGTGVGEPTVGASPCPLCGADLPFDTLTGGSGVCPACGREVGPAAERRLLQCRSAHLPGVVCDACGVDSGLLRWKAAGLRGGER